MFVPDISYALPEGEALVETSRSRVTRWKEKAFRVFGRGNRLSSNVQTVPQTNPAVYNDAPSVKSSGNQGSGQVIQLSTRDNGPLSAQAPTLATNVTTTQSTQNIQLIQTQSTQTSFQITSVQVEQNVQLSQTAAESGPTIPQISAGSIQEAGAGAFGRNTTQSTEKAAEGLTPPPEAGESLWPDEEKKEEISLEILLKATGKLMAVAGLDKHVLERFELFSSMGLKALGGFKKLLALNEPVSSSKSFEEQMGEKLLGRILGTQGPAPSLLAIVGPDTVGTGIKFGIGAIPLPGMQIVGNIAGNVVTRGMNHLMQIQLPYGTAYSIVQAAYLSKTVAASFHQVYAPILKKLTLEEQQDLITHAVNTAMYHVDQTVLRGEEGVSITSQSVMRSIGTEFMDLDARMPRGGLLWRKMKSVFIEQSGLKTYEARALLTSTSVRIGESDYRPIKQDDPRRLMNKVLVEKLLWRGVIKRGPVSMPKRFESLYRSGDIGYGRIMGFIPPAPLAEGGAGETAAAA
jgi:hypothetical protein